MNPVEIEDAISALADQPFDAVAFPYAFLKAFGNKDTTIKRLRTGNSNKSDVDGGVLQRNNIHIAVCAPNQVEQTLSALRDSPATRKQKAKFILATDGTWLEAEHCVNGETIACEYRKFPNHFGFFLALAGISTVKEIRDSAVDIRATSRLNRLYIELIKHNADWGSPARAHDMNHFMARLIFCFFAEDTDIFNGNGLFTATVQQMGAADASDTHHIISAIFRAMNTEPENRQNTKSWANVFPYVNGGLFSGDVAVPRFNKIARSYLLHVGSLDWKQINPDIFGSMIQAVANEEERSKLGMHYTSVPNILRVLNPLFLDDLRGQVQQAGDNPRKLLNLRKRIARIRVFDPACGSGNFLVIAYKRMRAIEAEINEKRGEKGSASQIPLTNFRGIELRDFAAEIARLALIIAEYQCDVLYRGQKEALAAFLPLDKQNWITCGNALRMDWLSICPPTGTGVKLQGDDMFQTPLEQSEIDFDNAGGETYICGNPPYLGSTWQKPEQKADLASVFQNRTKQWKSLDYVAGWFMKAADYGQHTKTVVAFVSTNSICQGQQVPILWPLIFATGHEIVFAHLSFKWRNLAAHNAGVTVVIVGLSQHAGAGRRLFALDAGGGVIERAAHNINAYLVAGANIIVNKVAKPMCDLPEMAAGNMPVDGGNLLLTTTERNKLLAAAPQAKHFIKRCIGAAEFIRGKQRYCVWIEDQHVDQAMHIDPIRKRIENVKTMRLASPAASTRTILSQTPHRFGSIRQLGKKHTIVVPSVSSENRKYLPCGLLSKGTIITNLNFGLYDAPLWAMALISSRLHLLWIGTVCGKLKTDFRYSNTLGWNTFPIPTLTTQNKTDMTQAAETILIERERHFPKTIADLYAPNAMPESLSCAHARNDEIVEAIYIGRCFQNDSERLEKLFDLYTQMIDNHTKITGAL